MNEQDFEEEIDLSQVFNIIKDKLLMFLLICLVCATTAFCITKFVMKNHY